MPRAADEQPCQRTGSGLRASQRHVRGCRIGQVGLGVWLARCWPRCRSSSVTIRGSGPPGYGGDAGSPRGGRRQTSACCGGGGAQGFALGSSVGEVRRAVWCPGKSYRVDSGSRRVEHHPVRDSGTAVGGVIGTVRSQPMTRRTTRSGQPERSSSRFTLQFRWREPSVGRSFRNSRSVFARRGLG
jgi:hypothetical protein